MARPQPPSIRSLAELTGFSKATVANALNGSHRVATATVEKVRAAAAKAGYQRNPMVGAMMSAMRRSQVSTLQGVLAVAEIAEPDRPEHGPFNRQLISGCNESAEALGFKLESYQLGPGGLSPERLCRVLKARGIRGLILLPSWRTPKFSSFDWSRLSAVYADYIPETPTLNSVCCDHYRSMLELLNRLHARGYRRPGLVLESGRDERVHLRMSAALGAFQSAHRDVHAIKPFLSSDISKLNVVKWIARAKPDVVLSHHTDVLDWMQAAGLRVPKEIGFAALNLAKSNRSCAGLDLRPREIGRCAVEILIGQIRREAWGAPRVPTNTTLLAEFVDGDTLQRQSHSTTSKATAWRGSATRSFAA